ncbi:fibropellin-1-like isoform X2 [Palaemon carinicauda]|uniref:fibropellin-1-like isoform X2 n=1 Tax=Palaemon carinicauda TaxID=392227 RepID=UPI0035B61985
MRRRTRRLAPFVVLLFLPLVVQTQDDASDNETTVVTLKGTEEVPMVTESIIQNNETEFTNNATEDGGMSLDGENGSLPLGDAETDGGMIPEETATVFDVLNVEDAPVVGNATEGIPEMDENVTESPDTDVAPSGGAEVTDGGKVTTEEDKVTTELVTAIPEPGPTTTKAPSPVTTSGPKCGKNMKVVEGACECLDDWVHDPANTSALECPCPNLCGAKGQKTCPDGTHCFHVTCHDISCKCDERGFYFDPLNEMCVDVCAYYGDVVCGFASNKTCQSSDSTDVGYTCPCSIGFHMENDTCVDVDECNSENPCDDNEVCQNSIGSYSCVCKQGFLRTSSGTCKKESSTSCECSDPTKSVCYLPPGGQPQCHPKPGYLLINGSYVDNAECKNKTDEWCGAHGECVEGEGGSYCRCMEGYVNSSSSNVGECVAIECPVGTVLSGSTCIDSCSLVKCVNPLRCVATEEGRGECECGVLCQGLLNPEGISSSLYYGSFMTMMLPGSENIIASQVTRSLSTYFGKGNVEVTGVKLLTKRKTRSTDSLVDVMVEYVVTSDQPNRDQELSDVIRKQCLPSANLPNGTCILPGNIIVGEKSIIVVAKDPCKDSPCPRDFFDCIPRRDVSGRYLCNCKSGFAKVKMMGTLGFCQDIDECNATKKICQGDQECLNTPGSFVCREPAGKLVSDGTMKDIAVAFGILFAATLLVAIGLGYLLMKRSHRVREMVPMTETNTGFENHAFHK